MRETHKTVIAAVAITILGIVLYSALVANEHAWNGGGASGYGADNFYLTRVPRAKLSRLQPGDYQFYTGGDGSLDTSWSAAGYFRHFAR